MDVNGPLFAILMFVIFGITLYMVEDWFEDKFKNKP